MVEESSATIRVNDEVTHDRFGRGIVVTTDDLTAIVRFESQIESVELSELKARPSQEQAIYSENWDAPLEVLVKSQAEAIQSTSNAWSVFSKSRITLLPHQLWVCRRVTERWPARWLVADDVGLGKTIEAGLILWPLLASGKVRRLLVICPASLVEQWQVRLREMFDIRLSAYSPDVDTENTDFWNTQTQVVASLQTLRMDHNDRQQRLLTSDPWDLLIVDEAHHLNADEKEGPTLGYSLVENLAAHEKLNSMVFFTGTPHRGKDYGFWSLLKLLNPHNFDPGKTSGEQLPLLSEVMIRNNKQSVTDLQGEKIFKPVSVRMDSYRYSVEEEHFYQMLTEFITTGKAYASGLSSRDQSAVMLILIAMQKLASSSVAAIRRALRNRVEKISGIRARAANSNRADSNRVSVAELSEARDTDDFDRLNELEEEIVTEFELQLMEDEENELLKLIEAADRVTDETKVKKIMDALTSEFSGEPVLLFTEYKATQSLVMSEIAKRFGDRSVTFINGDSRAEGVIGSDGESRTLTATRAEAAKNFNEGAVTYLVSTEAAGEGIDLQENCHTLFHIDLPWNPMRLHQRVGRLNRYGQEHAVSVVGFRNPDTVESRIWEKLDSKLESIQLAFGSAMDDPEDLKELVLGMASSGMINSLFADAPADDQRLDTWFDDQTAEFGGQDAIETVKELVGNVSKFDFQQVSDRIPRVDLEDMKPFFKDSVGLAGRQVNENDGKLSFRTPRGWTSNLQLSLDYEDVVFDRAYDGSDANKKILGIGHPLVNTALAWAQSKTARVASFPSNLVRNPIVVYRIQDRVTSSQGTVTSAVAGVELDPDGPRLLLDWQLLIRLNEISQGSGIRRAVGSRPPNDVSEVENTVGKASEFLSENITELDLPYRVPESTTLTILWPHSD